MKHKIIANKFSAVVDLKPLCYCYFLNVDLTVMPDGISVQPIYLKGKIAFWCQNKII